MGALRFWIMVELWRSPGTEQRGSGMCARGTFLESDIAVTGDVRAFSFS